MVADRQFGASALASDSRHPRADLIPGALAHALTSRQTPAAACRALNGLAVSRTSVQPRPTRAKGARCAQREGRYAENFHQDTSALSACSSEP